MAQPIRRVFGSYAFGTHEDVHMPPPGDMAPASIRKIAHDRIWEILYAPAAAAVDRVSGVLDHMQFLSIRRYLGFVFVALVVLLLALALWQ